ncbi:transmembrane protein 211 [Antrostomus carolinensis]|uniref:transmembrane protein 211 n=1 Tax=Antrostomus carolinensis TaxID=279965 RepID=UPI0010A9813F|nr:transmembrane protein 211 [Antrostomus carolinensis]
MADVCFRDLCGGNMNKLRGSIHPPLRTQCLLQRQASLLHPGAYSFFVPRSLAPLPKEKALLFRVQGSLDQCGVDENRVLGFSAKLTGSQTSAVLCAGGCALLALSSLLAIVAVLLPSGACERRVCTLAGYMQTAAVFIMASGLLVYPFGFNSATVKRFCENSDIYYAGDCQIGWGYMLAIVGVMLSVFLPFFAKYAPKEHISPTPIPTIL